jgi:hypothetical protein
MSPLPGDSHSTAEQEQELFELRANYANAVKTCEEKTAELKKVGCGGVGSGVNGVMPGVEVVHVVCHALCFFLITLISLCSWV